MDTPIDLNDPAVLDVRANPCQEKIARIFARWEATPVGGHFVLINQHEPAPVRQMLASQGTNVIAWEKLHETEDEAWVKVTRLAVTAATPTPPKAPCAGGADEADILDIDVRGLPPPEPMMRVLEALESLPPGGVLRARLDRRPVPLIAMLEQRGIKHVGEEQADGSWSITLHYA